MAKKSSKGSGKPIPKIVINMELSPDKVKNYSKHCRFVLRKI
jgi:hypothetical protein